MRPRVFVAGPLGPLGAGDPAAAIVAANRLVLRLVQAGYAPLTPPQDSCLASADAQAVPPGTQREDWHDIWNSWVTIAHAVLRLPGASADADRWTDRAWRCGIPVYRSLPDLLAAQGSPARPIAPDWPATGGYTERLPGREDPEPFLILRNRPAEAAPLVRPTGEDPYRRPISCHGGAKYLRTIQPADGSGAAIRVDVYSVLEAFGVTCPARQQALKKLLCAGQRDKNDTRADLREVFDALWRAVELQEQRERAQSPETAAGQLWAQTLAPEARD